MVFIMNNDGYELPNVSKAQINKYLTECYVENVYVTVPKFKIVSEYDLKFILEKYTHFRLPDNHRLNHKACIEVDEQGANTSTANYITSENIPKTFRFELNRPFEFHIIKRIKNQNIFLFSGCFTN